MCFKNCSNYISIYRLKLSKRKLLIWVQKPSLLWMFSSYFMYPSDPTPPPCLRVMAVVPLESRFPPGGLAAYGGALVMFLRNPPASSPQRRTDCHPTINHPQKRLSYFQPSKQHCSRSAAWIMHCPYQSKSRSYICYARPSFNPIYSEPTNYIGSQ